MRNSPRMGRRPTVEVQRSFQVAAGPGGPRDGVMMQRTRMISENIAAVRIPGMIPAMKSAPIDVSVITP